jgi:hypothetical protein
MATGDPPDEMERTMIREIRGEYKSLRDEFAMAALTGMIASETGTGNYESSDECARRAYAIAQAMLKAREEQQKEGG